jgi:hypothetical protein
MPMGEERRIERGQVALVEIMILELNILSSNQAAA